MIENIKSIFFNKKKVIYDINRKRKFKLIRSLFDKYKEKDNYIDDSTWDDLNIDKVYSQLDRTLTTPGEQTLYKILRTPLIDKKLLEERGKIIAIFNKNKELRTKIHEELIKLDRTDDDVIFVLKERLHSDFILKVIYNLFALISVVNIALIFIIPGYRDVLIATLVVISGMNMFLHYAAGRKIGDKIEAIQYTGNMIKISGSLLSIIHNELPNYHFELKTIYNKIKMIGRKSGIISKVEGLDVIADYINILFLVKERNYYSIVDDVNKYKEDIIKLYNLIGEIDAYISISLYRENLSYYSEPIFIKDKKVLETEGLIHPLLENPVANSISFEEGGMILTGSNMSGKSTFLRTIGVNALLAQTIYTVLANEYKSSFYKIVSSISLQDNIGEGKSYYFAEAEAILKMINTRGEEVTTLALIDEIFKGTNPVERINAAAEILNYLEENGAFTIVATHDLNLIPLISGYIRYYFMENMTDAGMVFDYKLRKGVSPTRNAVKILKYINYPEDLLHRIDKRLLENEG
ncbi:DNA mismatch repair protein MutS [Clostridium sp. D2Q-11]|uniref:DNA mismatch repair protein MutS n=1 Tax=Anaeromonas frigoriresistens TaxID=2683708 RepID=A0A942UUP9_9FIRM|nr:DNA mismatch repair protein MutS [Anaeromonas frigoriresistens]MBS4538933.1 DNA mismatch repair protein MutS [Anaeromonas frigoriresistens]